MKYKIEFKTIELKEKTGKFITTPAEVVEFLKEDFNPIAEEMYILIMDVKNQIIEKHLIAKGGYSSVMVKPADIFRPLLLNGGNSFIVAHNHPSGDTEPSEEDIIFTNKIKKASDILGVRLLDHVIYTGSDYLSFRKKELI